jgi:hypothetical protein
MLYSPEMTAMPTAKKATIQLRTTRRKAVPELRKKNGPWERSRNPLFCDSKKPWAPNARMETRPETVVPKRV